MKVNWTVAAQSHLKSIHDFVALDSPTYALRLVDRITRRTQQLTFFPESGSKVEEFDHPRVREVIEGSYRIIYRVNPETVDVLAVIHSARQLRDVQVVVRD